MSDADHLMLAELLPSLASGTGVDHWTIPLANYLVPDWALYGLALLLGPSPTLTVAIFMALQVGLLACAVSMVARAIDRSSAPLVTVAALGVLVSFTARDILPLTYLGAASTHIGTLILVLFALAATLRWLGPADEPKPTRDLAVGATIAFLAVVSDRLFVVWFLCPAATAIGLLVVARRLRWSDAGRWLATNLVAAGLALPAPTLLFPNPAPYAVSVRRGSFRFGLGEYLRSLEATLAISRVQTAAVVLAALVLAACLLRRRSLAGRSIATDHAVFLFAFLAALGTWVTIGVASIGDGITPHMRHYVVLFALPLALAPVVGLSGLEVVTSRPDRRPRHRPGELVVAVVALAPALATVGLAVADLPHLDGDRPPVPIACIDKAATRFGSAHGIASYWDARPIEVFSGRDLEVATVSPQLADDPTNTDLSEFAPTYDFAVASTRTPAWELPLDRLVRLAGPPLDQATCGEFTIANWGPGGLDLHPVDEVGERVVLTACDLPSELAEPGDRCVLGVGTEPPPGFLTYGPYLALEGGSYRVAVRLRSSAEPAATVGQWDVIYDGRTGDPIEQGPVVGTGGDWRVLTVDVVVPDRGHRTVVEIRLDPGSGPLEVSEMVIERRG